jgi:hypothetical protein
MRWNFVQEAFLQARSITGSVLLLLQSNEEDICPIFVLLLNVRTIFHSRAIKYHQFTSHCPNKISYWDVITKPWLSTHRENHCDERVTGCRDIIVEPVMLIQALGVTDSVLLLLQANDWHNEPIVLTVSHLLVDVRFFNNFWYVIQILLSLQNTTAKCARYPIALRVFYDTSFMTERQVEAENFLWMRQSYSQKNKRK